MKKNSILLDRYVDILYTIASIPSESVYYYAKESLLRDMKEDGLFHLLLIEDVKISSIIKKV